MNTDQFSEGEALESYRIDARRRIVVRAVRTKTGQERYSEIAVADDWRRFSDLHALFDASWLRSKTPPRTTPNPRRDIRIVDLFSGCGMMTLGALEACRALELVGSPILSLDSNLKAMEVYRRNFPEALTLSQSIEKVFDRDTGNAPSGTERDLKARVGRIDLMLGGPPCQGHSNLNNHTRRADPKNALLLKMTRAAEVLEPDTVVVENVRAIEHDTARVVDTAVRRFSQLGYHVDYGVLRAEELGVAQTRHRFFLIASTRFQVRVDEIAKSYSANARDFRWAAGDLLNLVGEGVLDSASISSEQNQRRIEFLFREGLYDLPNSERPRCHRYNSHTYKSVYGRLRWERPAQTITTGYGSMGQGRFVHPKRPRTITPREAARLQFIPDFFQFGAQKRGAIAEMIGNAVPPKLTYLSILQSLR